MRAPLLIALLVLAPFFPPASAHLAPTPAFTFGAAGDFGYGSAGQATMAAAGAAGLDFFLVLGDTDYGDSSEATWCSAFRAQVPHVLVEAGNHDTGESAGSNLNTLLSACPYTLNETLTGTYGREWYFDYPAPTPLVRFIETGCGINFVVDGTGTWACAQGDAHYNFVASAIDAARNASIPWVVVAMHKNCITGGSKSCEVGTAFFSMLLSKRVDLVLQGHDHLYARSKQLACATPNTFVASCVAQDGADGRYAKGQGSVVAIVGTGGKSYYPFSWSDSEAPYFAAAADTTAGFLQVDVYPEALLARFVRSAGASFSDEFVVAPAPALSVSQPAQGAVLSTGVVAVAGTTDPLASVSVNGARAEVAYNGNFSIAVPLWPGNNTITVTARSAWGVAQTRQVNVTFDDPAFHLRQDLDQALADLEAARAAAAAAQNASAQAAAQVANLTESLAAALDIAGAAQNASGAATAQVASLSATLGNATQGLAAAQDRLAALEASGNATQEELAAARADVNASLLTVTALSQELGRASQNATDAMAAAQDALEALDLVTRQLGDAQADATAARVAAEAAQAVADAQAQAVAQSAAEAQRSKAAADAAQSTATLAVVVGAVGAALGAAGVAVAVGASRRGRGGGR